MPYILPKKKEHTCYKPVGRNAGIGALWQCPYCRKIYKLVSHDEPRTRWLEITAKEADQLLSEAASA